VKFIDTIKNIWTIKELRDKILFTLLLVLVYRIGSYVVLPGVDPSSLDALAAKAGDGILGMVNVFAGGAFSRASIMALGIMPYISASIAVQLLTIAVPYFQKLQKEGESGRRQINQITRILTIIVTMVQGAGYLTLVNSQGIKIVEGYSPVLFTITAMIVLSAGTLFAMWIGEKITDNGIGNGISLLIMVGIIAGLPGSFVNELSARFGASGGGLVIFIFELIILFLIIIASIALVQATRRVAIQYAKRNVVQGGSSLQAGGNRQYLPLKVNASGVMPIIFAQAIMFLPSMLIGFISDENSTLLAQFNNPTSWIYNISTFLLIVVFTYFYTAMVVNPVQIADQLKKDGGFIPGVKPGNKTADYIDNVVSRITLPGSIFLGIVAILPAFAMLGGVNTGFAYFFGGTSLLIMVGVILDTIQQIESHLMMRHYDGLMKGGSRIKGRQGVGASI
jgi:preprotein translocase subunit SecY